MCTTDLWDFVDCIFTVFTLCTCLAYSHIICRLYENTILPESHRKPYLIYAYSDFCFHCMQVAPIWEQTQEDLEKIGTLWLL